MLTDFLLLLFQENSKRLYKVLISHFCDQNLTTAVYAFSIFASVCLPEKIADEVVRTVTFSFLGQTLKH